MELRKRRKLLVASAGIATITYAVAQTACRSKSDHELGDDSDGAAPEDAPVDLDGFSTSGNLTAPPPMPDARLFERDAGEAGADADAGVLADAEAGNAADSGADADAGIAADTGTDANTDADAGTAADAADAGADAEAGPPHDSGPSEQ